jgi:MFS family permease
MTQAAPPLRRVPGFRLYATARVLSWGGSSVSWIALPVAMYQLTASPLWTASVVVVEAVPYLVFGLLAGALADRFRHLTIMVRADLLSGAVLLTIPGAHLLGVLTPLQVLTVACLVQGAFVFYDAANFGLLPLLVGRERILPANGLLFAYGSATEAVAPAVAGVLLAVVAAPLLVGVDALSFLASALLLGRAGAAMGTFPETQPAVDNLVASVLEGIRYLVMNKVVGVSTCVSALLTMANGGLVALLVVWAHESFGIVSGDLRLGLLYAGVATAGVMAGVIAARLANRLDSLSSLRILIALAAAASYAMLGVDTWEAAAVLLLAAGTCSTAGVITVVSLRQQIIPQALQSRVNTTARMIAFGAGYATGATVGGVLAEQMSAVGALRIVFSALVIAAVLAGVVMPRIIRS